MKEGRQESLPVSTLGWLSRIPTDRPVCLLIRHAARPPIPHGEPGFQLSITDEGVRTSIRLGRTVIGRVASIRTSPVLRCIQTAEAISAGAEYQGEIVRDERLGDPGVFVIDDELAWTNWQKMGHTKVMAHVIGGAAPLPGMAPPERAAAKLSTHMLRVADETPGLHLFVTHDLLVAATVARLLQAPLAVPEWPIYLEAAFFWSEGRDLVIRYREKSSGSSSPRVGGSVK